MKNVYFGLITVLICQLGLAQIEHGGFPFALEFENKNTQIPTYTTPEIDLKLVEQEDAVTDQYKETMYRFGIDHEVDVDFFELANTVIHKERIISRLQIYCPDARSVNFLVDDFYLPEGSQLFVYSPNGEEIKGAFTAENNRENRIFPVGLVGGDQIVIEYSAPLNSEDAS
ncbi:MAG: hypothetical protein HKO93_06650, partial [Flavobacteriales bacterium]|nr:hypothetical protein [Flavobacteriales bacterium]